jgi:hypothetical protein
MDRRLRLAIAVALPAALVVTFGAAPLAHAATVAATSDSSLNTLWNAYGNNASCGDWSGGDATNSIVLPDGERSWFFSDTFLGSPANRKTLFYYSGIRNSIVMQNGSSMRTLTGGNTCQEHNTSAPFASRYALTPATDGTHVFDWTGDQIVSGSNLIKFYYGGNSLTTSSVFAPEVASIPLTSLENPQTDSAGNPMITITPHPFSACSNGPNVVWGASLLSYGGYIYVYGWLDPAHVMYLARTSLANLTNTDFSGWQFYDGASGSSPFSSSCASAVPLAPTEHDADFSVDLINGSFWVIEDNGSAVVAYPATTPWGFTTSAVSLYTPPENSNTGYPYYEFHYGARLQPGLTGSSGSYVISYNVNTTSVDTGCVSASNHDASIYRPRFIDVASSAFNAAAASVTPAVSANTTRTAPLAPYEQAIRTSKPIRMPVGSFGTPKAARVAVASAASISAAASGIDSSTDWYSSCPAIPAASGLSATPNSDGSVTLTWSNTGTDVWYYGYQCDTSVSACSEATAACTAGSGYSQLWGGLWVIGSPGIEPSGQVTPSQPGHTYDWYVCSFGAGGGNGGNSNVASATSV